MLGVRRGQVDHVPARCGCEGREESSSAEKVAGVGGTAGWPYRGVSQVG